jgi:chromosome segregation protein
LAKERHADAVVRLDAAAAERDRLAEELAALPTDDTVPGEDEARLAVEAAERKRADAAAVVSEKRQASDVVRKRLSEQSAAQAAASTRLMRAERDADAAAVRLSSIEDQLQQVEQAARVTEAAVADLGEQADDDVEKLRAEATQARERSDEAARRLAEIEAGVADARREVNELRERRAALGAHRDALAKDVAAEAEAGSGLATTRQHVDIVGTVSSLLDVPVEWSTAVEAALADRLTDVVVQTRPMDLTWTTDLKEAVRLLPRTSCSSSRGWTTQCSEGATAAVAVVRSSTEGLVDALLCDVLLVDELPREASATHSLATRDGRVLWPDGTLRVGPTLRTTLSRRAELDGVEADVRANQAQLDDATRRLEAAREQQDEAATLLANAGATATEAATHLRDAERDADTRQRERDRVVSEAANTKQRLERLRHERDELADGQAIARATVAESTREQAAADEVVDALSRKVADADRQLSEASTAASDGRLQHARAEAHLHALLTAAEQSRERRLTTAARADAAAQAVMELGGLVDRLDNEVAQADQALAATEARADASGDLQEATQQAADAKQQRLAAHERHQSADRDVATKRAELSEVERDATAASIRLETHVMRCRDEMQLNIPDLQTQGDDLLVDEKASEAELADLQGRLSRLGGVNPKAAEELEALEERREEIEREARDVRTAVADLRRMIEELDHERDERFTATFEKVREEFNGLFRRLFGGGKAELSLREIEDSAEPPGVEVVARPPGKKPVTMSQLSGGEKSMISVALLMSLFRSRPGPFCMLDEVDAALDEANTKRFCSLLDDFIGETQFIIVTHSKPTMKAADVLYGVTMPQPGVSRRVEVRFDQVGANSEIAVVN